MIPFVLPAEERWQIIMRVHVFVLAKKRPRNLASFELHEGCLQTDTTNRIQRVISSMRQLQATRHGVSIELYVEYLPHSFTVG